jgi:hypothetical protein
LKSYEFDASQLIQRVTGTRINRIGVLPTDITLQLLACVTSCEDISEAHAEDIVEIWREAKRK